MFELSYLTAVVADDADTMAFIDDDRVDPMRCEDYAGHLTM